MIIMSRTPMRISFFGGGTDYPDYFRTRRGAVLGMAINKYIYIAALKLDGIQAYNYRVAYSVVEHGDVPRDIKHNVVREGLLYYDVKCPLDISVMADMPASSGLGSSSTFTVGFLNILASLRGENLTKLDLALRAIHLEQDLLKENVGVQDQLHAAFGGLNRFDFEGKRYRITPVMMRGECLDHLSQSLLLLHTGVARHASKVVTEQVQRTRAGTIDNQLDTMLQLVDEASGILESENADAMLKDLGRLMHESWTLKKSLSPHISNEHIDALYDRALELGAFGGKLCGAGGGGFLLVIVPPQKRQAFIDAIAPTRVINVGLDTQGSRILY